MLAARLEQKNGMTKGRQKWRDAPLTKKAPYKPDAGDRHVRFDEREWETERCQMAQATAPILDSTFSSGSAAYHFGGDQVESRCGAVVVG